MTLTATINVITAPATNPEDVLDTTMDIRYDTYSEEIEFTVGNLNVRVDPEELVEAVARICGWTFIPKSAPTPQPKETE